MGVSRVGNLLAADVIGHMFFPFPYEKIVPQQTNTGRGPEPAQNIPPPARSAHVPSLAGRCLAWSFGGRRTGGMHMEPILYGVVIVVRVLKYL